MASPAGVSGEKRVVEEGCPFVTMSHQVNQGHYLKYWGSNSEQINPFFSWEFDVLEDCNPDKIVVFVLTWLKVGVQCLFTPRMKTFKKVLTFT